jgi:hypothetical protein
MLKNQRKDTYQSRGRSLQLPPSLRFPRFARGTAWGALTRFPLRARGTLRRGSSAALAIVNFAHAIGKCLCSEI